MKIVNLYTTIRKKTHFMKCTLTYGFKSARIRLEFKKTVKSAAQQSAMFYAFICNSSFLLWQPLVLSFTDEPGQHAIARSHLCKFSKMLSTVF